MSRCLDAKIIVKKIKRIQRGSVIWYDYKKGTMITLSQNGL